MNMFNWEKIKELVERVPFGLELSQPKGVITKAVRQELTQRDALTCQCCGLQDNYGNPGFAIPGKLAVHHIIPNGAATLENLITLCKYCHNVVHLILYILRKWRYVPMR